DLFEVEYWSLEQAKLKSSVRKALTGQVAVITGGGSGIGRATARAFAAEGATIAILDRDQSLAEPTPRAANRLALRCDVTHADDVVAAFDEIVARYGGLDILISNAGAAWQGRIGEVSDGVLRRSFELNFFAHQRVAQHAVKIMRAQGTGGLLLFNVSKQAINPGPG